MEGHEHTNPTLDGEQHMIAAAYHIVKALRATNSLSTDFRAILAELDSKLSAMTTLNECEAGRFREVEDMLNCAQGKIMNLQSTNFRIWGSGTSEGLEYLQAVDEVRKMAESLESLAPAKSAKGKELFNRAHNILEAAMGRLQDELFYILSQNKQCFEHEYVSFHSCEDNVIYEESFISTEDNSVDEASYRDSTGTDCEEHVMDLVHPDMIPLIKSIAGIMFSSRYDKEFCLSFTSFWKDALDEYFIILDVEKLSIEEVINMDWKCLNYRIRKWCWATKNIMSSFLVSLKRLFDQTLGELGNVSAICFIEASKASVLCLLNFGQAVAMAPQAPERLFCLLDMYEVLADLCKHVDVLFAEDAGLLVRTEFQDLLWKLMNTAKIVFLEFGSHVASDPPTAPSNGGVHALTKYVMNYIPVLAEYCDTLNFLLEENEEDSYSRDTTGASQDNYSGITCPVASHLQSVTSILEANLDSKSNLYKDDSLKHIFMLNNIRYMVKKIQDSKIKDCFGDEWIKKHIARFRQHATNYERATWSSILLLLRDDGNKGKAHLKEKCKKFSVAFEEVYKIQTGWCVPDVNLREDLKISASQNIIHAYRNFLGRVTDSIGEKHIKYTADDLQKFILDLFEGSSKSPNYSRRR